MLSINNIANVVINTVRTSAIPTSFDTGLLLIKDSNFVDARRLQTYTSADAAAAALVEYGFATTSEPYKAALKYFAASPAPSKLLISCYPASESAWVALNAVLALTNDFYGVMYCDAIVAADLADLAARIEALSNAIVLFAPITSYSVAADSAFDLLYTGQYKRTFPFYCTAISDCAAVLGTAMGLELAHKNSSFAMAYKTIQGILAADLTESQVAAIEGKNGNVYVVRSYTHYLLEKGSMANGQRYDEVLYVDKIGDDLQNAAVSMLADNPDKMPQTDDSTAQFINRFSSILMNYTDMGVLASSAWRGADVGPIHTRDIIENGFMIWADTYDNQSDADRAAHKAVPIQIALTLAGSIESIVITVNVQV